MSNDSSLTLPCTGQMEGWAGSKVAALVRCFLSELQEWSRAMRPVLFWPPLVLETEEGRGSVMRYLCSPGEDSDLLGRSGEHGRNCMETGPHPRVLTAVQL